MRRLSFVASVFLVLFVLVGGAIGQPGEINRRIREMDRRIDQGVRSGELTRHEATRLRQELRSVRRDEARMRADGRLNRRERERLDRQLDRLGRDIFREKHDDQQRRRR